MYIPAGEAIVKFAWAVIARVSDVDVLFLGVECDGFRCLGYTVRSSHNALIGQKTIRGGWRLELRPGHCPCGPVSLQRGLCIRDGSRALAQLHHEHQVHGTIKSDRAIEQTAGYLPDARDNGQAPVRGEGDSSVLAYRRSSGR
jgi:hypothetical protein